MITGHREGTAACDRCRSQKLKCDKKMPCGRCSRLKHQCTRNDVLMRRGPPTRLQREIFKHIGLEYRTFRDRLAEKREARLMALGIGPDGRPLPGAQPSSDVPSIEEQARLAAATAALASRSAPSDDKNRSGARYQLHVPAYVAAKHKSEARQAALQAGVQPSALSSSAQQPAPPHMPQPHGPQPQPQAQAQAQAQPQAQPQPQPQQQPQPQPEHQREHQREQQARPDAAAPARASPLTGIEGSGAHEQAPDQAAVAAAAAAAAAAFLPSSNHSYPFGVLNSDDLHAFVQGYAEAAAAQAQAPPQDADGAPHEQGGSSGDQPAPPPAPPAAVVPAPEGTFNPDFYTTVADNADREAGEEREAEPALLAVHAHAAQGNNNAPNRVYGRFPHPHPTPARPHAWARRPVLAQQDTGAMSLADAVGATSRATSPLPDAPNTNSNTNEAAIEALLLLRDHGHAGEAEAEAEVEAEVEADADDAAHEPAVPQAPAPEVPRTSADAAAALVPVAVDGAEAVGPVGAAGPYEAGDPARAGASEPGAEWNGVPPAPSEEPASGGGGTKRRRDEPPDSTSAKKRLPSG